MSEAAARRLPPREHLGTSAQTLAEDLARGIAAELARAVEERGAASLVLSGGSTPRPLFAALAPAPVPWEKVWITLADERWVDVADAASNEALVRREMLSGTPAAAARFVGLKTGAPTAVEGCQEAEERLARLPLPFDVVVLGMGGDGHTASLFPGAAALAQGLDPENPRLCLAVTPPAAPHERLSLTRAALASGRRRYLHFTGADKWQVYLRALEAGPEEELPIRAFLDHPREPLDVYWAP